MSTRSYRHMTAEERETLSLGLAHGHSLRTMARVLGRAPSTVSRESARNTTRGRPYRACTAQAQAAMPSSSATTTAQTPGSLAVAVRADAPGPRAARPSRLPDVSNTRILTTCANTCRLKPSMPVCMCCREAHCGPNCWRPCVRRTRRVALGRGERIDGARSPI